MNQSASAQPRSFSFAGMERMPDPSVHDAAPWVANPDVREAFDQLDRIEGCLRGFAILMGTDEARLTGTGAEDVEHLINFLMEQHRDAMESLRDATWAALSGAR